MAESKKHITKGDILGIFVPLGLAVFTFFTSALGFAMFYLGISLFRLIIVSLQAIIVRKYDDPQKKFKKERRLSRFAGLLLLLFDYVYSAFLLLFLAKEPSTFFIDYPWAISVYGVYAIYKFLAGRHHFRKARKSWSPYREIVCALSYFDAMVTMLNATVLIFNRTSYIGSVQETAVLSAMVGGITILTFILALKLIKSRKMPNLMQ